MSDASGEGDRRAEGWEWLRYAHEDLITAEALVRSRHGMARHWFFLAHQASEKAIRAALLFARAGGGDTDDPARLQASLPDSWSVKASPDLRHLTGRGLSAQYPGGSHATGDHAEAEAAVKGARALWDAVFAEINDKGLVMEVED